MVHYRCGICRKRVESNKIKNRVGGPSTWNTVEKYAHLHNINVKKTDPLCGKCGPRFSFEGEPRAQIPDYISRVEDGAPKGRPVKPKPPKKKSFAIKSRRTRKNLRKFASSEICDAELDNHFDQSPLSSHLNENQEQPSEINICSETSIAPVNKQDKGQRSFAVSNECYACSNATTSTTVHTCNNNNPVDADSQPVTSDDLDDSDSDGLTLAENPKVPVNELSPDAASFDLINEFESNSQPVSNSQNLEDEQANNNHSQSSSSSSQDSIDSLSSFTSHLSTNTQPQSTENSQNSIVSESVSIGSSIFKPPGMYLPFRSFKPTDRKCFVCGESGKGSRCRVSTVCALDLGMRTNIVLPSCIRACSHHVQNGVFTAEAIKIIKNNLDDPIKSTEDVYLSNEEIIQLVNNLFEFSRSLKTDLDFGLKSKFSDEDFEVLLGVKKEDFEDMFSKISSRLNNSCLRSARNALALFMMKMRLNLSQQVLGILFGGIPQSSVSETIDRVSDLLDKHFVDLHLGYSEARRTKIQEEHQSKYATKISGAEEGSQVTAWDGTYIYVGKPSAHSAQRDIYSSQKKRSLVKEMMIVTPTGYIVNCDGAYRAADNDAKIMNCILMDKSEDGVWSLIEEGDCFIVDRGFKESEPLLDKMKIKYIMPKFMDKKQSQFTTQESNDSRMVTLLRWVVEVVNGRVKNLFRFFDGVIPTSYIPKIHRFFRIVCAITNAYHPPIFQDREMHENLATRIFERVNKPNDLKTRIEEERLDKKRKIWVLGTSESVPDFPVLTLDDLRRITLGIYQTNMAELYCREHMKNSDYVIYFNDNNNNNNSKSKKNKNNNSKKSNPKAQGSSNFENNDDLGEATVIPDSVHTPTDTENQIPRENSKLVMAKMHSRYSNSKIHKCFVEYIPEETGDDAILGWYCSCQSGARTLGCCSHVAAVIWFLGYSRYNEPRLPNRRSMCDSIINATARFRQQQQQQDSSDGAESDQVPEQIEEESESDSDPSCSDDGILELSDQEECVRRKKPQPQKRRKKKPESDTEIDSDQENSSPKPSTSAKRSRRDRQVGKLQVRNGNENGSSDSDLDETPRKKNKEKNSTKQKLGTKKRTVMGKAGARRQKSKSKNK